jgi:hypothetical protein
MIMLLPVFKKQTGLAFRANPVSDKRQNIFELL